MTENKRFRVFKYPDCKEYGVSDDVADCTLARFDYYFEAETLCEILNELNDENKELKDKNSQLQETLAFRSNQLTLMERLVDDLGSEEMARQMEEIWND